MRNYTYPGLSVGSMLCLPSFQRIMSNFSLKVNIFIAIFTRITITQHFLIFFLFCLPWWIVLFLYKLLNSSPDHRIFSMTKRLPFIAWQRIYKNKPPWYFRSILGYFSTLVTHFRSYISKDWELQYHLLANIYC